ncbi:MAG: hypothetical protein AAFZ09_09490 [Pseudomonadota bacterium]
MAEKIASGVWRLTAPNPSPMTFDGTQSYVIAPAEGAGPAVVVGFAFTRLPQSLEWMELVFGIPAIIATYGLVLWRRGFEDADRVLFRKNVAPIPLPENSQNP